jgi:hypothetical protein
MVSIQVRPETGRVVLSYRHRSGGSDWTDETYSVGLDWTACNLGGQRPWFICPARGCERRVAILNGGAIFVYRHFYRAAYSSQHKTRMVEPRREPTGYESIWIGSRGF